MKAFTLGTVLLTTLLALPVHAADTMPVKKSGGILIDTSGMTVYTFDKDVAGSGKSACTGTCATNWPAVQAGDAPLAEPYSAVVRDDGSRQLAYRGKPLYTFVKDKKAGDRAGDKVMNMWHVVAE